MHCEIRFRKESTSFQNFKRGKIYESIAADTFEHSSGLKLSESPLILHPDDPEHYAASPDRILDAGSISLILSFQCENGPRTLQMKRSK